MQPCSGAATTEEDIYTYSRPAWCSCTLPILPPLERSASTGGSETSISLTYTCRVLQNVGGGKTGGGGGGTKLGKRLRIKRCHTHTLTHTPHKFPLSLSLSPIPSPFPLPHFSVQEAKSLQAGNCPSPLLSLCDDLICRTPISIPKPN